MPDSLPDPLPPPSPQPMGAPLQTATAAAAAAQGTPQIAGVRIPRSLRAFESESEVFDVWLDGPHISAIRASTAQPQGTLISCPVDVHVHLDKTGIIDRVAPAQGDLHRAIGLMHEARDAFTLADVTQRMHAAVAQAHAMGTRAMRTHIDWVSAQAPVAARAFMQVRAAWAAPPTGAPSLVPGARAAHQPMLLQAVSLTPLDVLAGPAGQVIAADVAAMGGILGAFVYRNEGLSAKLGRVFELAALHGLALDFHVDEGLDVDACGLAAIAQATSAARAAGWLGRVTCGHACSLGVQPALEARATLALCAQAGIALVALPTTNLYLQGSWLETPVPRGITRLREAREAFEAHGACSGPHAGSFGLSQWPCVATDNVADAFFPYGSYDLLEVYALAVQVAHLSPADDWLASITLAPARAMGLAWDGRLSAGCPADLVLLAAKNQFELIHGAGRSRQIWRAGKPWAAYAAAASSPSA